MELLEKARDRILRWSNRVQNLWTEGSYIRASVTVLVPLVIVALALIFLGLGISAVVNFLRFHYAELIAAALVLWAFVAWRDKRKADDIEIRRKEQEMRERQKYTEQYEACLLYTSDAADER